MRALILAATLLPLAMAESACAPRMADDDVRVIRVQNKSSQRGWLGVSIEEVTRKLAQSENLKVEEGVYISDVQDDSPAEKAGIKEGDVIVEYDGRKVYDASDLTDEVRRTKPGSEVPVKVNRSGDTKILKATIERYRESRTLSLDVPTPPRVRVAPRIIINKHSELYGLSLEKLNKQLGQYFGAPNGRGVLVKEVDRESEGEKAGFKAGDVITTIGKEDVTDVEDIHDALDEYKDGEKAEFEILRKGAKQKISIAIKERPLSKQHFRWHGDDMILDLEELEDGKRFRFESEKFRRNMERMGRELKENMIELKRNLKKELDRVHVSVSV